VVFEELAQLPLEAEPIEVPEAEPVEALEAEPVEVPKTDALDRLGQRNQTRRLSQSKPRRLSQSKPPRPMPSTGSGSGICFFFHKLPLQGLSRRGGSLEAGSRVSTCFNH